LAICISSSEKYMFRSFTYFKIVVFFYQVEFLRYFRY
jgi:hypothetical protein